MLRSAIMRPVLVSPLFTGGDGERRQENHRQEPPEGAPRSGLSATDVRPRERLDLLTKRGDGRSRLQRLVPQASPQPDHRRFSTRRSGAAARLSTANIACYDPRAAQAGG